METTPIQVRERILSEAGPLFVQHGYDGISMREIAEACALSKAGIYYHFKDKEDLFIALVNANLDLLTALIAEVRQKETSARSRLLEFSTLLFTHVEKNQRAMVRMANQEMNKLSPKARATFFKRYQEDFIGALAAIFAEGIQRGELRAIDPQLATWVLLGMLYPFFTPGGNSQLGNAVAALDIYLNGVVQRTAESSTPA